MGLDFIELIFQILGRGIFWVLRPLLGNHSQLSEGAYELIGFFCHFFDRLYFVSHGSDECLNSLTF